jgi:hypothetical protein
MDWHLSTALRFVIIDETIENSLLEFVPHSPHTELDVCAVVPLSSFSARAAVLTFFHQDSVLKCFVARNKPTNYDFAI